MFIATYNSNNTNSSIYKSSLKSAAMGGVLGAVVQSGSLVYDKLKYKDTFQLTAKQSASLIAKNVVYCAGLSALLAFVIGFSQKLFRKNEN